MKHDIDLDSPDQVAKLLDANPQVAARILRDAERVDLEELERLRLSMPSDAVHVVIRRDEFDGQAVDCFVATVDGKWDSTLIENREQAEYIVSLINHAAALLAELKAARETIARLGAELSQLRDQVNAKYWEQIRTDNSNLNRLLRERDAQIAALAPRG